MPVRPEAHVGQDPPEHPEIRPGREVPAGRLAAVRPAGRVAAVQPATLAARPEVRQSGVPRQGEAAPGVRHASQEATRLHQPGEARLPSPPHSGQVAESGPRLHPPQLEPRVWLR